MATIHVSDTEGLLAALKSAAGGDTIVLADGDYGALNLKGRYGPNVLPYDSPVTITSATPGGARFETVTIRDAQNLTFDQVTMTGEFRASFSSNIAVTNSVGHALYFRDVAGATITGNHVSEGKYTLNLFSVSDFTITDNVFAGIDPARVEDARIGSIVEVGPADTAQRPSDRTIAAISENGIYRPSRHLEQAKFEGRVPAGDYEGYVDAHVRRLESLRRAGIAERIDADQWRIPEDFESRATAYDAGRNRQASIRVVSTFDLEKQIGADGATWLDRRLVTPDASDLTPAGFGQQVREAMDQRREHHIAQGDATRQQNGRILYRRNLLANLREREVARVGAEMASSKGLPFRAAADGENISGKFTGTAHLSSGKFAIVEKSHEFTLVPWRPVIDRQLGREVAGIVQGGSVSWQMGRTRGLGI